MTKMDISEQITYSTVLIRAVNKKKVCYRMGTGFIMLLCQNKETNHYVKVLITNKHVIEGSETTELELCKQGLDGAPIDTETVTFQFKSSAWIPHPEPSIDLCCVPIDYFRFWNVTPGTGCYACFLQSSLIPTKERLEELYAFEEVLMIGYPEGVSDEYNHKPIARKGMTASHPNKDYCGKAITVLDIAMFPGSSGSPVFLFNPCFHVTNKDEFKVEGRILLLGIACSDYTQRENVFFSFFNILKKMFTFKIKTHINLAEIIKSEKILDFEKMLQNGRITINSESLQRELSENQILRETTYGWH